METSLERIKQAIETGDIKQARALLANEMLTNQSAEVYYLCAQVALNDTQKREYLEKALALDPFHQDAYDQMAALKATDISSLAEFSFAPMIVRLTAFLIDAFILSVANRIVITILSALVSLPPVYQVPARFGAVQTLNPAYVIVTILIYTGVSSVYYIYCLTEQNGQTPGKFFRGIQIVSLNGKKITPLQAFVRNEIGYYVSSFVLLGFLWAFFDDQHQTWHDKLAKTVVVRKPANR